MAYRPSLKNRRMRPMEGLNLTPMIDIITNLMFFLLIFANVIPVAIIDAPLPKVATTAQEIKMAQEDKNKLEITIYIQRNGFTVKSSLGASKSFPGSPGKLPPYDELHRYLVELHQKKADLHEVTLMPSDDTLFDMMIGVMDASRSLLPGDAGFRPVPPEIAGRPESLPFNQLFPQVSIGGV